MEIAASFYENLYKSTFSNEQKTETMPKLNGQNLIEPFSLKELVKALYMMTNRKATGGYCISSDFLKFCNDEESDAVDIQRNSRRRMCS